MVQMRIQIIIYNLPGIWDITYTDLSIHTHPSTGFQDMFSPSPRCHQTTPRKCQECSPWSHKGVERVLIIKQYMTKHTVHSQNPNFSPCKILTNSFCRYHNSASFLMGQKNMDKFIDTLTHHKTPFLQSFSKFWKDVQCKTGPIIEIKIDFYENSVQCSNGAMMHNSNLCQNDTSCVCDVTSSVMHQQTNVLWSHHLSEAQFNFVQSTHDNKQSEVTDAAFTKEFLCNHFQLGII